MAKLLFISDSYLNESLGIMYLSAYLKANGHSVYLTLLSEHKKADGLISLVREVNPDLVGFSVMTPQVNIFRNISKLIKETTNYTVIWGGAHCITMPQEVIGKEAVDIVCTGEGEEPLLTLMNRLDTKNSYDDIDSLWVRKKEGWLRNDIGRLEADLDKYPFPDRALYYDKYPLLKNFPLKRLITQRGCPYNCAYCFEPTMKELYRGKGNLVRRHSAGYVIAEIKNITSRYRTRAIHFSDDTFNLNRVWLIDFLKKYKENVGLPFTCNISVLLIDEEMVSKFKDAGCKGLVFGLEHGVERIRMDVLNKKIKNKDYLETARLLRKYKLRFVVNTLFCVPDESLEDAIESVRFVQRLKPLGIKANILKIYKGTLLGKLIFERGQYEDTGEFTFRYKDPRNEHDFKKNMLWAGYLFIKFPILLNFSKGILCFPLSRFLMPLVLFSHWFDIKFFSIPLPQAFAYFWHSRSIFIRGIPSEQVDNYNMKIKA